MGTPGEFERAEAAADYLRSRTSLRPQMALVLGSGLGGFADELTDALRVPYSEIPYYPACTAEGHAGTLVLGRCEGIPVAAMQGRVHLYEGWECRDVVFPVRVFGRMGVRAIVLTNAAGGISSKLSPGCLVAIADHINLQGANPLTGANDERFGPRFLDMGKAYDARFRQLALEEARRLQIEIFEGVYAAMAGPSYETPAEIRFLRTIGADLVGMSTVAEVIAARHMGMRVLAISCVTNMAAGILDQPITHQEVLETGMRVSRQFTALLRTLVPRLASEIPAGAPSV
jgi:purine-nucleoside phosphorylase